MMFIIYILWAFICFFFFFTKQTEFLEANGFSANLSK